MQREVLGNRDQRAVFMPSRADDYFGDDFSETKHSQDTLSVVMEAGVNTC